MKRFLYKRFYLLLTIFFLIITFFQPSSEVRATTKDNFHILVINSYNSSSEWESFVIEGVKRKLDINKNINLSFEYLDIRTRADEHYLESFSHLLDLKYSDESIDAVLTIDDEAFNFARNNLFNSESIIFEKPIIFTGVNSYFQLSNDERNFISGVLNVEDNLSLVNMILNIHKNVDELNIILDNATYSQVVKHSLISLQSFYCRPIKLNFIQSEF